MPQDIEELVTDYGEKGYGGPRPPVGSGPHNYVINIYALSTEKVDVLNKSFEEVIEGKLIDSDKITGIYER